MGNFTDYRRVRNCMNTLTTAGKTCSGYHINSNGDDIIKHPIFEHAKVCHYDINENKLKKVFVATLTLSNEDSIDIEIPSQSETFSYSAWEFGFQWKDGDDRRSISFSLDTESPSWDEFNNRR